MSLNDDEFMIQHISCERFKKKVNASHYFHTPLFPSIVNVHFARLMPAPPPAQSTSSPLQTKMERGGGYAFTTKEMKPYSDEIWKERRM